MPLYFLSLNTHENRQMIDDHGSTPGCPILEEVEASSWLDAKAKFGFPLTTVQELLLVEPPTTFKQIQSLAEACQHSRRH